MDGVRGFEVTFYDAAVDGTILGTLVSGSVELSPEGIFNTPWRCLPLLS